MLFDQIAGLMCPISQHWERKSKPDLPPRVRQKALHYMHPSAVIGSAI